MGVGETGRGRVPVVIAGTPGGETVCRKEAADPMHSKTPLDGMAADAAYSAIFEGRDKTRSSMGRS